MTFFAEHPISRDANFDQVDDDFVFLKRILSLGF